MTIRFNLHVGSLTARTGAEQAVQRILQEVGPIIQAGSGQDIQLKVFDRGTISMPGWTTQGAVPSEVLHRALGKMTGFQVGQSPVQNIGILVADGFEPAEGFFGLMFDDAFEPGGSSAAKRVPREGCAVFLSEIERKRGAAEWLDETVFTAVHELAHVFNIQHGGRPSYMYQSAAGGQVQLNTAAFSDAERKLLEQCSTSKHIWPGGSAFGDLGDLAKVAPGASPANMPKLSLRIGLSHHRFFAFEPVELDVELANLAGEVISVPDALDAGYSAFRIWIEEPDGSRRFLRSPRHYCSPRGNLEISLDKAFRRDVSIFGESGGYTFRRAGMHRIWATFDSVPGGAISSNVIEVEVLQRAPEALFFRDASRFLSGRQVGGLLYYRLMSPARMRTLSAIDDFCATYPRHPASAMTHYATGRALARTAIKKSSRRSANAALIREARRHLMLATRRKQLGEHRRLHAEEALSKLPD